MKPQPRTALPSGFSYRPSIAGIHLYAPDQTFTVVPYSDGLSDSLEQWEADDLSDGRILSVVRGYF